jgi:hypothetical protein
MILQEVIKERCLPQKDCMLTVQDVNGETAFLYFKEAELIEANYATYWGKDALAEINQWELAEYTVGSLPLGIKRSLWDPIEILLQAQRTGGGPREVTQTRVSSFSPVLKGEEGVDYEDFKTLPGVTKLISFEKGKATTIFVKEGEVEEQTPWLEDLLLRSKALGETLGFGKLDQWSVTTDRYYVVGFQYGGGILAVLRKHEEGLLDFEAACMASLHRDKAS